jgi:hypothetical protein
MEHDAAKRETGQPSPETSFDRFHILDCGLGFFYCSLLPREAGQSEGGDEIARQFEDQAFFSQRRRARATIHD